MCTLIVFRDLDVKYPLIVAANRDEDPRRPTAPPSFIKDDILAPQDLVHGGSWIGINERGLIAALTNNYPVRRHKGRRSRGLIVTEALEAGSIPEAIKGLREWWPGTYNGFHLLLADGKDAVLIRSDGEKFYESELRPGFHVITGNGCRPGHSDRDLMVRGFWLGGIGMSGVWDRVIPRPFIERMLSFHGHGPEAGTCVHGPDVRMETTFSMIIRQGHLKEDGSAEVDITWREGRPCEDHNVWCEEFIFDIRKEGP